MSRLFTLRDQNTGASAEYSSEYSGLISLKTDWFDLLAPRDFQESSPVPQFEGISSLALCLLYSPALTIVHAHWEDKTIALTIRITVSRVTSLLFNTVLVCHSFPAKKQSSTDFMAAVTICSDFRA